MIRYVSAVMFKFASILFKGLYDTSSQIPHRENVRFFITDSWLDYMYILQLVQPWRIIYGLILSTNILLHWEQKESNVASMLVTWMAESLTNTIKDETSTIFSTHI